MLDYQTALNQLLTAVAERRTLVHATPLREASARVLAENIHAQYDSPQFDNSAMDGYALHTNETAVQTEFTVIGRIAAGDDAADFELNMGQAVRIFTGAPIPAGCNAVIAQEQTEINGNVLLCTSPPQLNQHIRRRGEDIHAGDALLEAGQILSPAAIGLATSQGHAHALTHSPLRVTVFSSGNELREPSTKGLIGGEIFDANRYQLLTWLQQLGCTVTDGGILPDHRATTETCLQAAAATSDLILTSGGVSVGEEDHLKAALEASGELVQWKLLLKPGKPFAWGRMVHTTVMMLPGNPVATFVTFKMLVEPAVRVLMGMSFEQAQPHMVTARADFAQTQPEFRREFLRGVMHIDADGVVHVKKLVNQGSHMLSACVAANVLIEIPPHTQVNVGDTLNVYPIHS
ncbi:Molybdopterin molybdenumtransferase [Ephemeroptericola cinctiostellae]|uniref:Molybdopterin molybdenumtransferase n=1 Tax=Ephemeroptericola cinctiostellae TaxID=2268024 RepID=A0A345DBA4_9BURK|nr:gephyrin-like molybdotransferase Glp [Ephemeroptericola cinctiostellae]AXF85642.1 Molybdopterin molybdenumtransferase [Ephemeroptericola cinctiostellae]